MDNIKLGQRVFFGYSLYRVMAQNGNGMLFLLPISDGGLRDKTRGPIQAYKDEVSEDRRKQHLNEAEAAADAQIKSLAVAIGGDSA